MLDCTRIVLGRNQIATRDLLAPLLGSSGQSYNAPTIVVYDSRVVFDLKLPHIMTLES